MLNDLTRVHVLLVGFCSGAPICEDSDSSLEEFGNLGAKKVEIMLCLIVNRGLTKVYYYRKILVVRSTTFKAPNMLFQKKLIVAIKVLLVTIVKFLD